MVSFVVVSYNQENFILEYLESLKYQILTFAADESIQLIVGDDGSIDRTLIYIQKWVRLNKELFADVVFVGNSTNVGLCHNVALCLEQVRGHYYKLLAGDDMYSNNNIFEYLSLLDKAQVIDSPCFEYNDSTGSIETAFLPYREQFQKGFMPLFLRKVLCRIECVVQGSTLAYARQIITHDLMDFILRFHLIEDQPMSYYVFAGAHAVQYRYTPKAYVIYRKNDYSISHSGAKTRVGQLRNDDMMKMCDIFEKNETHWFYRQAIQGRRQRYCTGRCTAVINFIRLIKKVFLIVNLPRIYFAYKNNIIPNVRATEDHIKAIRALAMQAKRQIDQLRAGVECI